MKVQIPEELKATMPQTTWGKILSATPVVMAVVATMLAGLASSEMTRAQYERSLGAQQQSKAGDQWSFFQAKRLRGAFQRSSLDLLQNLVEVHPLLMTTLKSSAQQPPPGQLPPEQQADAARVKTELLALLESPPGQQALALLEKGEVPPVPAVAPLASELQAALAGLEEGKPDREMATLLGAVNDRTLETALAVARDQAQAFDLATRPLNQAVEQLETLLARRTAAGGPAASLSRDLAAARLRYTAARYDVEARLNQAVANLYELQVRKSNLSAERHRLRSQRFFFGMLGAQLGVIIATFAIAARQRNLLWSLAAGAGLLAIAFAVYVYLCV